MFQKLAKLRTMIFINHKIGSVNCSYNINKFYLGLSFWPWKGYLS